jgi:methyl-galactoside transport system ATP-binding protein
MKCLFGLYSMDEGDIAFNGQALNIASVKEALTWVLLDSPGTPSHSLRSVLENIWLGRYPRIGG